MKQYHQKHPNSRVLDQKETLKLRSLIPYPWGGLQRPSLCSGREDSSGWKREGLVQSTRALVGREST